MTDLHQQTSIGERMAWSILLPVATWLTFVMWQPAGVGVATLGIAILVGILREKPYVD